MNRLVLLLFVALITFVIVMIALNPSYIEGVWLYIVGFAGVIGKGLQSLLSQFKLTPDAVAGNVTGSRNASTPVPPATAPANGSKLPTSPKPINTMPQPDNLSQAPQHPPLEVSHPKPQAPAEDGFTGTTLLLLRYHDDSQTTLGLLFLNYQYFCMTLEDTYRPVKKAKVTRIPAGTYEIKHRITEESEKTLLYRENCKPWFKYHLELQGVKDFQYIYIHSGGNHTHTDGCILVSDSITFKGVPVPTFNNSKETFRKLYQYVSGELDKGEKVRIIIKDEKAWFNQVKA